MLKKNTETSHCHTSFEDGQPLEAHLEKVFPAAINHNDSAIYYIMWYGDNFCYNSKESLNGQWIVSQLMRFNPAFGDRFFVNSHDIFAVLSSQDVTIDFKRLHAIEQHSINKFTITTYEGETTRKGKTVKTYNEYVLERDEAARLWKQTSVKIFPPYDYQN